MDTTTEDKKDTMEESTPKPLRTIRVRTNIRAGNAQQMKKKHQQQSNSSGPDVKGGGMN